MIDAAKLHCGSRWIYSLDLRDFFPSITESQVKSALQAIGYSERAAVLITNLCTLNGVLPQGSPASPVLSNLVFMQTDVVLEGIAKTEKVRYSRYADDLVFSGENAPTETLRGHVKKALASNAWSTADEKEFFAKWPARLKVHGLLVHGAQPRLTKGYRNKIRAFRHLIKAEKIKSEDLSKVKGHLAYASFIERG